MPGIDSLLSLIGRAREPELPPVNALSIGELNAMRDKAFVDGASDEDKARGDRAFEILQRRERPIEQVPPELAEQLINPERTSQDRQDINVGFRMLNEALQQKP